MPADAAWAAWRELLEIIPFSRVKYLMYGLGPAIRKGCPEVRERYACLAAGQAVGPIGLAGDV